MGYYEENTLCLTPSSQPRMNDKDRQEKKSLIPDPEMEAYGMYDTPPWHDIIEDDNFVEAFGPLDGERFQTYRKSMLLFGESIRFELKERREGRIGKASHKE